LTQIDTRNGSTSHGGDHNTVEVIPSTLPIVTHGSAASLSVANLNQGNHDR